MNRVVLAGRLAGSPRIAYTPFGIAVATFRLLVPRYPPGERQEQAQEEAVEEIDCVAFRVPAIELATWGERGCRVNLEGRLRLDTYREESGRPVRGLRVHVDQAYAVDPVVDPPRLDSGDGKAPLHPVLRVLRALPPKAS